jgi:pyrimidine-specific ribonucleoside hydrolase
MIASLDGYLAAKGVAKAMHDLVAAACVLDEAVCDFREVEIYQEKGEWGARAATGTRTWISVGIDHDRFVDVMTG